MDAKQSFLKRHPFLALAGINIAIFLVVALVLELVVRSLVEYSIDYYTGTDNEGVIDYPFGEIVVNSLGFADAEFDLTSEKPRIGYFGDSVNYGTGAGYPYRVSELVEQAYPQYDHWNLGGGVAGVFDEEQLLHNAREFNVEYAVYLLNLNDVFPLNRDDDAAENVVRSIKHVVNNYVDVLRSRSYLYNYLRLKAKNALQKAGFEASGYRAYELWPAENEAVFREFAKRVNDTSVALKSEGRQLCVILLPYEMQISGEAADAYREMGFLWEDGFENGSPQEMLTQLINEPHLYDPMPSFNSDDAKLGEYFVYNQGDKIDWNHPNRAGHSVIADSFMDNAGCPFIDEAAMATQGNTHASQ